RLKPNVSAYAFECRVAAPNSDHTYKWVAGTSFSCPLVAGFAACAWQNHPEYTALQLKREIEKCAELYPYYDYAVGYGVPQAGRFLNPSLPQPEKTFDITQDGKTVYITPHNYTMGDALHYHIRRADGRLYTYRHVRFDFAFTGKVEIELTSFGPTDTLCVWYNGYSEDIALTNIPKDQMMKSTLMTKGSHEYKWLESYAMGDHRDIPSTWGNHAKNKFGAFYGFGTKIATRHYDCMCDVNMNSIAQNIGVYYQRNITKGYGLGVSLSNSFQKYSLKPAAKAFPATTTKPAAKKAFFNENQLDLELYQQIRLASGYNGSGCSLDIGVFGSWVYDYTLTSIYPSEGNVVLSRHSETFKFDGYPFDWGFSMRVNYAFLSLYAKLRSGVFDSGRHLNHIIPFQQYTLLVDTKNLEIGLMMKF
ncbi:MAG: S8 family serine peptidase, partial [Bacteroidales bacterium]|nr:S8 family serine peptidase [Bacteroidales bacterium]